MTAMLMFLLAGLIVGSFFTSVILTAFGSRKDGLRGAPPSHMAAAARYSTGGHRRE